MSAPIEHCVTCPAFEPAGPLGGFCHRHTPAPDAEGYGQWPYIKPTDFCFDRPPVFTELKASMFVGGGVDLHISSDDVRNPIVKADRS